eukprot:14319778-Alexandrium_andersonii.AAC.1
MECSWHRERCGLIASPACSRQSGAWQATHIEWTSLAHRCPPAAWVHCCASPPAAEGAVATSGC